jgi:hypothetical protein
LVVQFSATGGIVTKDVDFLEIRAKADMMALFALLFSKEI